MKPEAMTDEEMGAMYTAWLHDKHAAYDALIRMTEAETTRRWEAYVDERVREEREECAKVCDEQVQRSLDAGVRSRSQRDQAIYRSAAQTAEWNAAAIRARGSEAALDRMVRVSEQLGLYDDQFRLEIDEGAIYRGDTRICVMDDPRDNEHWRELISAMATLVRCAAAIRARGSEA